jgi:hypothetical protein
MSTNEYDGNVGMFNERVFLGKEKISQFDIILPNAVIWNGVIKQRSG